MREPNPATPRVIHDVTIGALAGFTGGFVAGLFLLRVLDSMAAPFAVALAGAVLGGWLLVRHGRHRRGLTLPRLTAWVVLVLSAAFLVLLYDAIQDFE